MQYCKCVHAYMCTCIWDDDSQVPEITFKWNFTGLRPVKLQKGTAIQLTHLLDVHAHLD